MRKETLLTAGSVIGVVVLLFFAVPALVWLTGATFGQRCDRLHPGGDATGIEQCIAELRDPLRAAYRAGYQQAVADMAKAK